MSDMPLAVRTSNPASSPDTTLIVGWGADADTRNDPTYPYRNRSEDDHSGEWKRPTQQEPVVELLKSVEHKWLPAVFGTASPPSGVSGSMRRLAFRWSESNWAHWLLLIAADRVNMVEGVVEDLARGHVPNIPKEMGVPAEWRHNKVGLVKKVAVATLLIGGAAGFIMARRDANRSKPVGA